MIFNVDISAIKIDNYQMYIAELFYLIIFSPLFLEYNFFYKDYVEIQFLLRVKL